MPSPRPLPSPSSYEILSMYTTTRPCLLVTIVGNRAILSRPRWGRTLVNFSTYMYRCRFELCVYVRHSNVRQQSTLSITICSNRFSRIPRVRRRYVIPPQSFDARWSPLIVVTRSRISTASASTRSVRLSTTTREPRAFSSRNVTRPSRMFSWRVSNGFSWRGPPAGGAEVPEEAPLECPATAAAPGTGGEARVEAGPRVWRGGPPG